MSTANVIAASVGVGFYLVMQLKWWLLERKVFSLRQSIRNLMLICAALLVPAIGFLTWDYFQFERQNFDTILGLILFLCAFEAAAAMHWFLVRTRSKSS